MLIDFNKYSFFIAFYAHKINGQRIPLSPAQPLIDYLMCKNTKYLAFIDQPVALADHKCCCEIYHNSKLSKTFKFPKIFSALFAITRKRKKRGGTFFRLKIRDILSIVYFFLINPRKYDFFIGSESINTIVGIILRKLGLVNNVIYYVIDLGPDRYRNKIINWFYLKLDKFCTYHSDFCWNTSAGYEKLRRERFGYRADKMAKQINISFGLDSDNINILPESQLKNQVVFIGSIEAENGIEVMIDSVPEVVKKVPEVKFIIIGAGPQEDWLKEKIRDRGLEKFAEATGHIFDRKKIKDILCQSKVGLAIFPGTRGSMKAYGDPIKFKEYMACGLPIITTNVPMMAEEIKNKPLGLIIEPTKESLADAIVKILEDDGFFRLCRNNALIKAREYSWPIIFNKAFTQTLNN